MENYLKNIDKQIEFNQGKNIFLDDHDMTLKFIDETIRAISETNTLTVDSEEIIIDYTTNKAIEEFCRINQYFTFNRQAINDLKKIYTDLFSILKTNKNPIEPIEKNHYRNLKQWLFKTNPFAEKIYSNSTAEIKPVACAEYTAEIQIDLLRIDISTIMGPVLDIGCGKQGNLVKYIRKRGIRATGIDRFLFSEDNMIHSDWLEFNYGTDQWGTIVSNLGFSNHFKHHNLREDGNYREYATKYMKILKSLKVGGSFHYAPDLPFIENYLDNEQYQIKKYDIGEFDFKTTIVKRL